MDNGDNWTYNNLKENILKIFKRVVSHEVVYRKLRARNLKPTESCRSYIMSMLIIASTGGIDG